MCLFWGSILHIINNCKHSTQNLIRLHNICRPDNLISMATTLWVPSGVRFHVGQHLSLRHTVQTGLWPIWPRVQWVTRFSLCGRGRHVNGTSEVQRMPRQILRGAIYCHSSQRLVLLHADMLGN